MNFKNRKLIHASLLLNALFISGILLAFLKIGSPCYLFYLAQNRGQGITSLKKHRTSLLATLPKKMDKIVMLGNSITAECEWAELLDNQQVINRGVIGDGTFDILNRLNDIVEMKPRKVFLLVGVNDLQFIPLSKIIENYEKIINRLRTETPATTLFLVSILPIHNDLRRTGMKNEDINVLNSGIQKLAEKYQLTYVDVSAKLKNTEGSLQEDFSLDGVHLNGAGYGLVAKEFANFVR